MRSTAIASVALIALLAISAAAASTASAKKLILTEGGTLAPANTFELFGPYNNLEVTTSSGFVSCEESFSLTGLEVSVLTNSHATDELQVDRVFGGFQDACRSFTGNAYVELSLSGPLKLRASGKASTGAAGLVIGFEHLEYHGTQYPEVNCYFSHKSLSGSNSATATPQELEVQLGGKLALEVSRSAYDGKHICPKSAVMSLHLPSTANEAENAVIEEQVVT